MQRVLSLCADDFGQSPAINGGILRLLARGRLTAVSCLVNGADWADGADAASVLMAVPAVAAGSVSVGLHFNLTHGRPLSATLARHWPRLPALPRLIAQAHLRLLPVAAVGDELAAQLHAFEQAAGRAPQHIDGHQHVHHLPQVRDLLLAAWAGRDGSVRHTGHVAGPGFALKRWLIEHTGGRRLGQQLVQRGVQANAQLLGVYDFAATDYRHWMQRWLAALPARGGMVFCHPGLAAHDARDPIAAARARELAYLDSAAFDEDLAAAGVQLRSDAPPRRVQPTTGGGG